MPTVGYQHATRRVTSLGMSRERIARRTAAFFFLTSMANVAGVILFPALYQLGVLNLTCPRQDSNLRPSD